ncbi:MAG TPA: amidohydrolase family protein [Vicinamibacteria bacterium]|nr:amidohydrolase family protein [Vicinamibacteria bacterium]
MTLYSASWVVPVSRPPIAEGRVAVEGGRVTWVGRAGDPGEPRGAVNDLGPGVILPGLVNAHCHLELSHLAGLADRAPAGFVPWVEALMDKRGRTGADEARAATRRAIRQLESTGTVAVGDVSNALAHLDLLEESHLHAVVFYELLGWDPARAEAILAGAEGVMSMASRPELRTRVRIAAHAPYSVSPELLAGIVSRGGPAAMHLAESPDESRFLATGDGEWRSFLGRRGLGHVPFEPPGVSPIAHVDALGGLRQGMVAAHCVQVDEADCALIARRGAHVAVCPRSNRSLRVGMAPVRRLLDAGVRLCLGTDSLASAPTLDLMADMALLQSQFPELAPEVIVRMATLGGAEALGLPALGAIEPGRSADLAFVPAGASPPDPLRFLTSGTAQAGPLPS